MALEQYGGRKMSERTKFVLPLLNERLKLDAALFICVALPLRGDGTSMEKKTHFFLAIICPEVYHNYIQKPNKAAGTDLLTLNDALDIRAALSLSPG